MTTMAKAIRVKDTAFGQDMLEVLAERQLEKIAFHELDISLSILTLKEHLVKKLSHGSWKGQALQLGYTRSNDLCNLIFCISGLGNQRRTPK